MLPSLLRFAPLAAVLTVGSSADSFRDRLGREFHRTGPPAVAHPSHGSIERLDRAFDDLVAPDAAMERLASGFGWSEGPTWLARSRNVVFSDVPGNVIHAWSERDGLRIFLKPSGYTGSDPARFGHGSNGLLTDARGRLVICQHGDRQISRLEKDGTLTPLVGWYRHRRLNSPNDAVHNTRGDLYFTDPPYGLAGLDDSPDKELAVNGVYRLRRDGTLDLLDDSMTFPNGIAFSPDQRTLYVNQSDPKAPLIRAFDVRPDGTLANCRTFFDAGPLAAEGRPGLPDGLRVDVHGNLFATGPGGVLVIDPAGRLLGILNTGVPTGNCCWGDDGRTLYITANHDLLRIRTRTLGAGFVR